MRHLLRASRTAAAILALVVIDVTFTVHPGAAQAVPLDSSSTPSPSASATPCPSDLTGNLCLAMGATAPSPTPSPTPAPTQSQSSSSTTSSSSSSAAAPAGSTTPQKPSGGSTTGAHPAAAQAPKPSAATMAQVAATFHNAPFLRQLLDILDHPTSSQRPDLRHFRPATGAREQAHAAAGGLLIGSLPAAGGTAGRALGIGLAVLLLVAVLAVLLTSPAVRAALRRGVAGVWRLHPSLHHTGVLLHNAVVDAHAFLARQHPVRWLHRHVAAGLRAAVRRLPVPPLAPRRLSQPRLAAAVGVAVMPAIVLGAVMVAGAPRMGGAAMASSARPSLHLRSEMAEDDVQPVAAQPAVPAWTRLITIERGLVGQQDELAAQEGAIQRLVISLAGNDPDSSDAVQVGDNSEVQRRDRLAQLVAAHAATQAAYQASLQAEYELYRAAAQDPAQRAQLTAAAAAAPQAKDAVAYNLSLIQTQLSQEQAISQAEGGLQALGSLSAAQLDAMRHHQAFIAPEIAPISQVFGPTDFALEPPLSFNGVFYPHFHTGLDIAAPLDTPIHAAADGVVLLAAASVDGSGKLVGYGNYVVIAHPDGFVTLYGHLDSVAVKAGQVVHQGEIVGLEGSTGWSTGPHVHFEIRHLGQFLDPAPYVGAQLPAAQ